ncbi:MAG: hypothetical protein FDX21_00075 [Chlorobium sp.]|nr:MAG: hypothetical protein FDX21_00075 [Chlorobium sp.]
MKRQKIECWQCKRIFSLLLDTAGEPTLIRECPYCHASLKLDFGGEQQNFITIMRGVPRTQPQENTVYQLPEILKSSNPSLPQ